MADNISVTPGTGADVGADLIGGILFQRVKLIVGADGTNDGDVAAANPLPVTISSGTVTISGVVAVTGSTTIVGTVTVTGSTSVINTVAVTGNTAVLNVVSVTGNTAVLNVVSVTGSTSVISMPTVTITGSTTVIGTVTVTGSTSVINTVAVTGSTTVLGGTAGTAGTNVISVQGIASMVPVTVTGSTTVIGTVTVTGSTSVINTVTVTGSTSVLNTVAVTGNTTVLNVVQNGGVAISLGAGASDTGTRRVVLPNDQGKTFVVTCGTLSATNGTLVISAASTKIKVYAISITTTSTTQQLVKFQTAVGGADLWIAALQAPSGASAGANISVTPPAYLFASPTASILNLSLSSANAVHYSVSYFMEA